MWIRDVDVHRALIDAHRSGDLVIFVGAGASRDSPADLPDFRALARDIAADAQAEVGHRELEQPDVLLGRLLDRQVDVHHRVRDRLGVSSSTPNRLHRAIVDLATSGPTVRIVTTNYDRHLSTTLHSRGIDVAEFAGPALPMGDDFAGLVYLHGRLQQEPRQLVVTDRDFGRAYLRDAWAARFLERMFAAYTTLFVGYSHGDVVMRYLARSLGGDAPRYILTPEPDAQDWSQLGIEPVGYTVTDGSHSALVDAIEGWASFTRMGLLDHRQYAARLLSVPPSQVPEEASYLEALIAGDQRVRLFAEFARGEEWLAWAAKRPEFQRLFDPSAGPTDSMQTLAHWFAEQYVVVEDFSHGALRVVRDAGGRLSSTLWSAIGHQVHSVGEPRPKWLSAWLVLLIQNAPEMPHDWLDYAMVACRWPEDRTIALLLFDHLTEPQSTFRPAFGVDDGPGFEVVLRGHPYWVQEAWQKLFAPNLPAVAAEMLPIVERHLRRAYQLLACGGSAGFGWDPVSFQRSAVETHQQDEIPGPVDALIEAARDSIEALLDNGNSLGPAYLESWSASDVPMLRRLAVHGWSHRSDVDATAKIAWLRKRKWLFDHQIHHEVFRLIETALSDAKGEVAEGLVGDAAAGRDDAPDDEHRGYERFNALSWIVHHAPALRSAQKALEEVQAEYPHFEERAHPDLLSWMETGFVQRQPPMTAEQLHQRITTDPSAAVAELRQYEAIEGPFEGPTWGDALSLLAETVQTNPTVGFIVLDANDEAHPDISGSVIRGWARTSVDNDTAEAILDRLRQVNLKTVADDLTHLLSEGGRGETNATEWHRFSAARQVASDLWSVFGDVEADVGVDDWHTRAINHPAGRLAQFWIHAVAADWRDAGDDWSGLPAETTEQLDRLLAGDDARTAMAEVLFASQLRFFFGADQGWCQRVLLPILDWQNPTRARRAWDGFLQWGRSHDKLLTAGLLNHYLSTVEHIDQLGEGSRRQLHKHLAGIALSSELESLAWIRKFTATVGPDDRVEWMNQIAWMLEHLPVEAIEHQWRRWMRDYWQGRLDSIPLRITVQEASAMAGWAVHLGDSIEAGVALAMAHPAQVGEHGDLLRHLDHERLDRAPTAFARLLQHLLGNTQPPVWIGYPLKKIVARLLTHLERRDVDPIIEEALRLGCNDAPHWSS